MTSMQKTLLMAACMAMLPFAAGLFATNGRAQDSNVKFDSGLVRRPPKPGAPEVKPQPRAWPRLDPGSVLCRTEDDLGRLAARRHGEAVAGQVDCRVIRDPTAVSIVQRNGPGRTEVKVTAAPADDTGWTDAWLPQRAPPAGTTSVSR
jgi:hypothetical protein